MRRKEAKILALVIACTCALIVEWAVLTTFVFPVPKPFDSWSPCAKEYGDWMFPVIGSGRTHDVKARAEEIARQTDMVVNIADLREAICWSWFECDCIRMSSSISIDRAVANGLVLNSTVEPYSPIDTLEKAYQELLIREYAGDAHDRILELMALDTQ